MCKRNIQAFWYQWHDGQLSYFYLLKMKQGIAIL